MRKFIVTFGFAHKDTKGNSLTNCYTVIEAENKEEARKIMFSHRLNSQWATIYDSAQEAGVLEYKLSFVPFSSL